MWLIFTAATLALLYSGACLWLYLRQDHLVFIPTRGLSRTPAEAGLAYEALTLPTADGERLGAWYVPAPATGARPWTLLYCHGNAGTIADRVEVLAALHREGLAVLIFDYRGYGESTGRPTEAGTHADALAAWRHLTDTRGLPPARILVHGHSLGGAVAAGLAADVRPGALWLESTFTSLTDLGAAMYPLFPVRRLSRYRYDTLTRLSDLQAPLLITHARHDETIPIAHGERLYQAAREPKGFVPFDGDHNTFAFDTDPAYRTAVRTWLNQLDPGPPGRVAT